MYIGSKIIMKSKFGTRLLFKIYRKHDKLMSTR